MLFIRNILKFLGILNILENKVQKKRENENKKSNEFFPIVIQKVKEAKALRLRNALDYAVQLPFYQKGYEKWADGSPKYFCNVFAMKFLAGCFDYGLYDNNKDTDYNWLNYDLSCINKDINKVYYGILPHNLFDICKKLVEDEIIKEHTPGTAQAKANEGIPILVVCGELKHGHEAIVYPNDKKYDDQLGCKIGQAGNYNISDVYISDYKVWGSNWKQRKLGFFEFNLKED